MNPEDVLLKQEVQCIHYSPKQCELVQQDSECATFSLLTGDRNVSCVAHFRNVLKDLQSLFVLIA